MQANQLNQVQGSKFPGDILRDVLGKTSIPKEENFLLQSLLVAHTQKKAFPMCACESATLVVYGAWQHE